MPGMDSSETVQIISAPVLAPGTDFGTRYRIEALLGQGGMGRVYKAYDKDIDRIVAIKVVREGFVGDADALKRFKQELNLASKISHKHILRIHDMGSVGDTRYISMAYVEGPDLHHILKENPTLPLDRALKFARQLAEALAAAHAEGVVHRDLKPQNILVDKDDLVYVSDFGLAKSFEEGAVGMTKTGAFLGTPRYMSPEQVEGKPVDQRSDLYAYGLILYEMLTGDVPFTGESTLKVMYQRIQEKPKNPKILKPSIPNWVVRITMRCLERDAAARYQSAYEILADLQGSTSSSSGTRSVQIQIPEFAERRWIWAVAGVILLLVLAFAIPAVRHRIIPGSNTGSASVSGIPPLSSGLIVAVLPIQVLGDPSQFGYLAQGVEEALTAKLSQLKEVHVAAGEANAKLDQTQPLEKLARQLGANLLVQGTLQGQGNKVRVVLSLQDVPAGKRRWTQEFDGVAGDLFTLEDQIYGQLVSALTIAPTNEELAKSVVRPTDNVAAYDLYLRGRNSLRGNDAKNTQTALDYFEQALKDDPKFALAYTGVAQASLRMNAIKKDAFWTQKALAAAQQAQQINDQLPEVHYMLGAVYRATGKYSEAIAELTRAQTLAPNSDDVYRRLGSAYLVSGNAPRAIEAYQKAIELNPYYWVNQNSLGRAYFQVGQYPKALEAFQKATQLEPDVNAPLENAGGILVQQGKYSDAVPYLEKALKIEPDSGAYSNLGTAYLFLKRFPEASQAFEKALALNPNDMVMAVNLGDAYRGSGQAEKAQVTYQQAISIGYKELQTNSSDAEVMAEMALAYAKIGKPQEASDFIRRARAQDKNDINIVYAEAQINALLGKSNQALDSLREALEKHYPADFASVDPDLDSLHGNPGFQSLIRKYSTTKQ
jgi:serine/threonine protein kinase/tetratricopeptide (TPR) repeat protein